MNARGDELQKRLAELEGLLIWEGSLGRARVMKLFGLRQVRASEWIREFRNNHPRWVDWDSKVRVYHATTTAYREFRAKGNGAASLSKYLSLVGLPSAGHARGIESMVWEALPEMSVPHPRIFATLLRGITKQRFVEITYMSMRHPEPHRRLISPHSLVRAGRRWHVRAFSATDQEFRDYTLGRITDAKLTTQQADRGAADDAAWTTKVKVRLMPHPDLSEEQARVIQIEYFDGTSGRVDTCRGSLVSYFLQDIRAALDPEKERAPEYQIAVENTKEVLPWVFR